MYQTVVVWWHFRGLKWHQRVWILYIQLYYIFFLHYTAPQCVGVCVSPGGWPGSSSSRCTASLRTHVLPPASRSARSKKSLSDCTFGFSPAEGATFLLLFLPSHLISSSFHLSTPSSPLISSLSTPFSSFQFSPFSSNSSFFSLFVHPHLFLLVLVLLLLNKREKTHMLSTLCVVPQVN